MGDLADEGVNEMIDHIFITGGYTMPTDVAIALGSAASTSSFSEVGNTGSYARVAIPAGDWNSAAARVIDNANAITFPTATGTWGASPGYWGIFDSSAYDGGILLAWGAITTPTAIDTDDTPSFAAGEINISFNAHASNVGIGTAHANTFLDHMFGKSPLSIPSNLYVGFGTVELTEGDTITGEATGNGYAREILSTWDVAAGGVTANTGPRAYTVSGTWTSALDVIFISDSAAGTANANLFYFGTITPFSAESGDTVSINAGDLDVTIV